MQLMRSSDVHAGRNLYAPESTDDIHAIKLTDLFRVVRARQKIIIFSALAAALVTTLVVTQLTPLYTSTAVVMLDQRKNNVADTDAVLSQLPTDASTVQNQVQILTSLELAQHVVTELHLERDADLDERPRTLGRLLLALKRALPTFGSSGSANGAAAESVTSRRAHQLLDRLSVTPAGLSTAMQVSFRSVSPTKAAFIANGFADAYVEDQLDSKFDATKKATQWLAGRIQELSRQAELADAAVQRYKAQHNINETDNGSIVDQQTAAVSSQLVLARADLAEKQARYNNLVELQKSGHSADSPIVLSSTLIATLRAQEADLNRQLADLSSKYLPDHPKIVDLRAQKANLEQKIEEEVQRVVESVRNDVSATGAHVASLQQSLSSLESQGTGQNESKVQLTALQSNATSARSMYEAFLARLNQAQGQEGIQTPDARVISRAEAAQSPSFPKRGLLIAISIPGGLFLGFILAFVAERIDPGFRTTAQLESLLGFPVMAVVPEIKAGLSPSEVAIAKPLSAFSESIRGIQLGIKMADVKRKIKTIAITSAVPGEGKTTLAISLTRIAARGGLKTLLIDGDLRRPNIARSLGLNRAAGGLIEVLTDTVPLERCIITDQLSGAHILPCLNRPTNPTELLTSAAMRVLLKGVHEQYDLVIIDCAPVLPVNDTKIMSEIVDGTVIVTRWEKTPREAVANALRSLTDARASVLGFVMSRADHSRFRYYNYGYQDYSSCDTYYAPHTP